MIGPYDFSGPCIDYATAEKFSRLSASGTQLELNVRIKGIQEQWHEERRTFSEDMRLLSIEAVTDESISRFVHQNKCFGVVHPTRQRWSLLQRNCLVSKFRSTVKPIDLSKASVWRLAWNEALLVVPSINTLHTLCQILPEIVGSR